MPDNDHIAKLRQGVAQWNQWRKEHPDVKPDFSGADLPKLGIKDLSGANLKGADLQCAILRDADLSGATLNECTNLTRANLANAAIAGTTLLDATLWDNTPGHQYRTDKRGCVRSVCDLLSEVRCVSKPDTCEKALYFRGHESSTYHLQPSVSRAFECGSKRNLLGQESEMLIDLMVRRPQDFERMTTALDQWGLARHHRLPTRLLDVTRNPLVALYNACDEVKDPKKSKEDGVVHVFVVPKEMTKTFASDTISVICSFAKLPRCKQLLVLGELSGCSVSIDDYHRARGDLYHHIRQERPNLQELIDPRHLFQVFFVQPRYSFERVRAQSGAFLISASHNRCDRDPDIIEFEPESILSRIGCHNRGMPMYEHLTFTVPQCVKDEIRNELKMVDITDETLFPGLDESAKAAEKRAKGLA